LRKEDITAEEGSCIFVYIDVMWAVACRTRRFYTEEITKSVAIAHLVQRRSYGVDKYRKHWTRFPARTEISPFTILSRPVLWTIQAPTQLKPADQLPPMDLLVVFISSLR